MRRYTSSQLRSRLAEILDAAERGERVVVERRGTRFTIRPEHPAAAPPRHRRPSLIAWMDPAIEAGGWTWDYRPGQGLRFRARPGKKR